MSQSQYAPVVDLECEAPPSLPAATAESFLLESTSHYTSQPATQPATQMATQPATQMATQTASIKDGVFTNLPKSKSQGPKSQGLPSYDESLLIVDEAPPYLESTPFSYIENGDVLVDGMLVGSWNDFIVTCMMSFLFDFLGYFITTLLSTSHGGKCGAKFGLGLTLIRLGILVQDEVEFSAHKRESINIVSLLFVVIGAYMTSKSLSDYLLYRRGRQILRNLTDF